MKLRIDIDVHEDFPLDVFEYIPKSKIPETPEEARATIQAFVKKHWAEYIRDIERSIIVTAEITPLEWEALQHQLDTDEALVLREFDYRRDPTTRWQDAIKERREAREAS